MLYRMAILGLLTAAIQGATSYNDASAQTLPPRVMVGAQQAGTLQHTVASALAKVASDATETTLVVQPYAGATALLPVLNSGELDFGVSPSVDYALSYFGADQLQVDGRNPYPHGAKLRLVMGGSPLIASLIVRDDSPIRSAKDLAGRKVAGEFPAQLGAYVNMYAQLRSADLSWDDVTVVPFSAINDSLDAVVQGTIDATVFGVGAPRVREADASAGVRFVSSDCSEEAKQRILDAVPGYYTINLKAGSQAAVDEDVCTTAYQLYLVTHEDADPAMVEAVLKAIWDNIEQLPQYHPSLRNWNREAAVPVQPTLPFHPAAIAFYRSVGAWSDGMDEKQETLLKAGR